LYQAGSQCLSALLEVLEFLDEGFQARALPVTVGGPRGAQLRDESGGLLEGIHQCGDSRPAVGRRGAERGSGGKQATELPIQLRPLGRYIWTVAGEPCGLG
jgi:hypothetical protein